MYKNVDGLGMRHGTQHRRQRNNRPQGNGNRQGGQPRMQVFDSNGPDVRIRGTAHQVAEKYMTLAKDATSMGDRVLAESYLQHAEHYQRVINRFESDVRPSYGDSQQSQDHAYDPRFDEKTESVPEKDDLSLPASILGQSANVPSEATFVPRTPVTPTSVEVAE